ncbi:uncharacterized protein [Haliotis cracherodii]|uniref:uncharacterized protein n=1 Tax=Haliotis cracherodii TaxID=6455 RepID=UPI0039ED3159
MRGIMYVTIVFLSVLLARSLSGLILPLTKPDGTADMSSLLNHVSLLSSLQATTMQVQTELQVTKKDVQTTQSQLQTAMNDLQTSTIQQLSAAAEISSLKDEVISMKAELRLSLDELITVKTQFENMTQGDSHTDDQLNLTLLNTISHDVKLNTAQVNAVQADLHMVRTNLTLATSEVSTLKRYMSDVEKQSLDNKQSLTQALQMLIILWTMP